MSITFVYCSETRDFALEKNLMETSGIENTFVLHYKTTSFSKAYNKALRDSSTDIVCFVRKDVVVQSKNWGKRVLEHFEKRSFGILGIVGSIVVPMSGLVWENRDALVGRIWYEEYTPENENRFSEVFRSKVLPVVTVDDAFFLVHKQRVTGKFSESFEKDSFYDLDFCLNNYAKEVSIGVFFDVKVLKKGFEQHDTSWIKNQKKFVNMHRNLPFRIKPRIIMHQGTVRTAESPKVSIIVTCKDNPIEVASCLEAIEEKVRYPNYEVCLIDMGSNKENQKSIKQCANYHNNVKYSSVKTEHYPSVCEEAIQSMASFDSELYLFCQAEIVFLNDVVSRMVKEYLEDPESCGTIGVRIHEKNHMIRHFGLQIFSMQEEDEYELSLGYQSFQSAYLYKNNAVKNILGSSKECLMISKKLYDEIGGFNKKYINGLEDFELNLRAIQAEKTNILAGSAVCYYTGQKHPKFLLSDFEELVNFINKNVEIFSPYVDLVEIN